MTIGSRTFASGGTISIPLTQHQSLKVSYSTGAIVAIGGNFRYPFRRLPIPLGRAPLKQKRPARTGAQSLDGLTK
jgi:hypothetical protein